MTAAVVNVLFTYDKMTDVVILVLILKDWRDPHGE